MDNISSVNFQGNAYVMNGLSNKPKYHIQNASKFLQKLVENKDYNIYIKQNYVLSKINLTVATENELSNKRGNTGAVLITSAAKRYVETAKALMKEYETIQKEKFEENLKKENMKSDIKDFLDFLLYIPVFIAEVVKERFKIYN